MCRLFAISTAFFLSLADAQPGTADACRDQIAALYDGGAPDRFARPRQRDVKRVGAPKGDLKAVVETVIESPLAIWELTAQVSSGVPEMNAERHVIEVRYDPDIAVTPPG
jgi:hypothetical protein